MSTDYFLKVFHALMVLGPWCFIFTLLITVKWMWSDHKKKDLQKRTQTDRGLVDWMLVETHSGDKRVALRLQQKHSKLKWVFVGDRSSVPYSVKEGSVVEIKYLVPRDGDMDLQVGILSVKDMDARVVELADSLRVISADVRHIRGADLPEASRDELG